MKTFAVFVFLCAQVSIAWSLFKIAEHQNTKDISILKYTKTFFAFVKKIITNPWTKTILAFLFFLMLAVFIMGVRGCIREKRQHRSFYRPPVGQYQRAYYNDNYIIDFKPEDLPSRRHYDTGN